MGSRTEPAAHQEFNVSKSKAGGQSMIMKLYLSWTALSAPRSRYSRSSADTSSTAAPARFLSAGMTSSPSTWDFWTILSKGSFKIREWYSVWREGSFAKPIAAVVLAWESQSTRRVG